MKRRDFLRTSVGASLLSLLPRSGLFAETSASLRRPNVLFLFSDQHNATVTGYAGSANVHTPHLDALAAQGTRFDRAYCQNGVCAPSRNSLMTGQYPRTNGVINNDPRLNAPILTHLTPLQRIFKKAGYYTFTTGKRHLCPVLDTDWDYTAGDLWHREFMEKDDTLNYWKWIEQQGQLAQARYDFSAEAGKAWGAERESLACRVSVLSAENTMEGFAASQTIEFLKSPRAKTEPFFAWSTFYRPHQPYTPIKSYADAVDYEDLKLPSTIHQDPSELPPVLAAVRKNHNKCWDMADVTEPMFRRYIGYYSALVAQMDDCIGAVLATLEEQGLAENTIVVYSSDHGDFVGGHGLPEKIPWGHNFYEETLRVPLLFRWPNQIKSNVITQDLVELVDIYPTLLSLCGLAPPVDIPPAGRDLNSTLTRQTPVGRKYIVSENLNDDNGQASVITDDFKYGQWLTAPKSKPAYANWKNMLVNRSADPGEGKNLCNDPDFAAKQVELQGYLKDWVGRIDDSGRRLMFSRANVPYAAL
jgi:arylsulfatase A-like enzyme